MKDDKNKSRLQTFGCSFTAGWLGPSWAHILAHDYDEHICHAKMGVGNSYIFHCVVNTDIQPTDTVMIMWTYPERMDLFGGTHHQSITDKYTDLRQHRDQSDLIVSQHHLAKFIYKPDYVARDKKGGLVLSNTLIQATKKLLDAIGCEYRFFSFGPWYDNIPDFLSRVDMKNLYIPSTKIPERRELESKYNVCKGSDWPTFDQWIQGTQCAEADQMLGNLRQNIYETRDDFHPTTGEFAEFLTGLGYNLTEDQTKFVDYWQDKVLHSDDIRYDKIKT